MHCYLLWGWEAKTVGRESLKEVDIVWKEEIFRSKMKKAIDEKLRLRAREISKIEVPLRHYYVYGGKKVEEGHLWVIEHIEERIKLLKEHYSNKE